MLDLKIICEDEKYMPIYANKFDACMDLKIKIDNKSGMDTLLPGDKKVYGTGIKVDIPKGFVMFAFPRSSTGIKLHCALTNTVGVIDSGYKDEIRMALYNFGKETIVLKDGQRLAQFLVVPRPTINLIPVEDSEEFHKENRGGGIGSSGLY